MRTATLALLVLVTSVSSWSLTKVPGTAVQSSKHYRESGVGNATGRSGSAHMTARALLDITVRPGYWVSMLRAPALKYSSFTAPGEGGLSTIADAIGMFDPPLNWDDLDDLRARWPGKLVLKGPVGPADAARAVAAGVDGIHRSNHGGRQLDRCGPAIDLVRPVREAIGGQLALIADSGIRHGSDVAVAIARGADLCMIGRG